MTAYSAEATLCQSERAIAHWPHAQRLLGLIRPIYIKRNVIFDGFSDTGHPLLVEGGVVQGEQAHG